MSKSENSLSPPDPARAPGLLLADRARLVDALAHLELTNGVVQYLDPAPAYAPRVADSVDAIRAGVAHLDLAINQARASALGSPGDDAPPA